MNSSEITKLLRTKPNKYVIKDYTSKNATSSCWSTFGLPAEIIDETTNEFKIIDGFASSKVIEEKAVSYSHRTQLIDSIANWCVTSIRPFQCVEDPGFVMMSQVLLDIGVRYGRSHAEKVTAEKVLPCANTVKRRVQSLTEIARIEVASRLAAAGSRDEPAFSPDI
ncbi:unnamed protein product [Rotaria sp. Silwood1]|nr:unnamed protein product [Rotaria sp. Silwood1]